MSDEKGGEQMSKPTSQTRCRDFGFAYHLFKVRYSYRPVPGNEWVRNGCMTVVAQDIDTAISIAKQRRPDATIWSAGHHGRVEAIEAKIREDEEVFY